MLDGSHASSFASSTHNHSGVYMPAAGTVGTTTRYYAVASSDFMPVHKTIDYQHTNGFVRGDTPGQAVTFLAPIHLPHGARMTQFIAVVKDSDASQDINIYLVGQATTGGGWIIGSSLSSSGTPGQTRINSTTFNETINN